MDYEFEFRRHGVGTRRRDMVQGSRDFRQQGVGENFTAQLRTRSVHIRPWVESIRMVVTNNIN